MRRPLRLPLRLLRLGAAFGGVSVLGALAACNLVVGASDYGVAATGGPPDGGDATVNTNDVVRECTTTQECRDKNGGKDFVCEKTEGKCRPLTTNECPEVIAGRVTDTPEAKQLVLADDETIYFGFIMDLYGANAASGLARRNAVALQVGEFHPNSGRGIPGGTGGKPRPIAFVICSEVPPGSATTDAKKAAAHLIDELHVPAIIGAQGTDSTLDLLVGAGMPSGTLIASPSVSSASLTSFADNELFWRTAPSGVLQIKAMNRQVLELEAKVKAANPGVSQVKLAIVYSDEAFGNDLSAELLKTIVWNGKPVAQQTANLLVAKYNQAGTDADFGNVATTVNAFAPHLVVLLGRGESPKMVKALEGLTPGSGIRPEWLFTASSNIATMRTEPTVLNDVNGVRSRMRGTIAVTPAAGASFDTLYNGAAFPAPANKTSFGTSGSYDWGYLLTYAALAASPNGEPLNGTSMIAGLKRILQGDAANTVNVGVSDISRAMSLVRSGANIKVKGVSYEYDFDTAIGEAPARFDTWCARKNGAAVELPNTGFIFDPTTSPPALTGSFACPADQ